MTDEKSEELRKQELKELLKGMLEDVREVKEVGESALEEAKQSEERTQRILKRRSQPLRFRGGDFATYDHVFSSTHVMFPTPPHGLPAYFCPFCRRRHRRNSTIGHFHKVYVDIAQRARRARQGA